MKHYCNYCDPKYLYVYGFCRNCQRRCEPPLFDKNKDNHLDYLEMIMHWQSQRSDLVLDEMRRNEEE